MFRLEIKDPTKNEALISQNLVCQVTGIIYEVEEFRSPVSVKQCYNCPEVSDIRQKQVDQNKNVSSAEITIPTKDAQIKTQGNQNLITVRGHMLHLTKGCLEDKK